MKLKLKRESRYARVRRGHPWVFSGELLQLPDEKLNGTGLVLEDERGRCLGSGIINTQSNIVWRRYSTSQRPWDRAFMAEALQASINRRFAGEFRRLVWSESDDLPGLVVDQFGDVLVVQALTLAVDQALPVILDLLQGLLSPRDILVRNDAPTRQLEGLEPAVFTRSGNDLAPFEASIDGIRYSLDLQHAQKTGFYLDQRAEHQRIRTLSQGRRVLDAFCNQGSFGLQAALGGAASVLGIDASADAVRLANANATRNSLSAEFREMNVFDYFTAHRDARFDLIVLDPPSFAPNRRAVDAARKGYHELHLRALRCLAPGGILATYCCSHHISRTDLQDIIENASIDARKHLQVLTETSQPADHPVRVSFAESAYLHGCILRVL